MPRVTVKKVHEQVEAHSRTLLNITTEQAMQRQRVADMQKLLSKKLSDDFFEKIDRAVTGIEGLRDEMDRDNGKPSIKTRLRDLENYMAADLQEKQEFRSRRKEREKEARDWKRQWIFWAVTTIIAFLIGALVNQIWLP